MAPSPGGVRRPTQGGRHSPPAWPWREGPSVSAPPSSVTTAPGPILSLLSGSLSFSSHISSDFFDYKQLLCQTLSLIKCLYYKNLSKHQYNRKLCSGIYSYNTFQYRKGIERHHLCQLFSIERKCPIRCLWNSAKDTCFINICPSVSQGSVRPDLDHWGRD